MPPPQKKNKKKQKKTKKIREKYFSGKNHVKFGKFVNFSCIYFRAKISCPPKLTELLRLWQIDYIRQKKLGKMMAKTSRRKMWEEDGGFVQLLEIFCRRP